MLSWRHSEYEPTCCFTGYSIILVFYLTVSANEKI